MADPFFTGPREPGRTRSVQELTNASSQERTSNVPDMQVSQEEVTSLFDGFAFQINRATALIKELEKKRKNEFVPVDKDASRVQSAVRRRDQGSTGLQISFDLYKNMIDAQIKAARNVSFEIVGELSGELVTDAKKIDRYLKSGGKGLSTWEEFLLYADQWLILFMLDRLTTQFQCQQHKEVSVAKQPPGSEDPPILLRNAISVGAMMLILGMREQDILVALGEAGNALNIPPVDLLNRARRLEKSDLDRALTEMVGADDPSAIISYVENYISRHSEGYDDWIAYADLKRLREDASVTYIHAHEYSQAHSVLLDYSYQSVHQEPTVGFFGQLAGVRVTRPLTGPHYEALRNKLAGIDLGVSSIVGTMTYGFAMDVLCCLARFFGKQDIAILKKIRTLLRVMSSGINGNINTSMLSPLSLMDTVVQATLQKLIGFVEKIFDRAALDVNKWINGKSDKAWDALYECPLIGDLIAYIVDATARLRNVMFNMVTKYAGNISDVYQGMYRRWGSISDARRIGTVLRILDDVISTLESCSDYNNRNRDQPDPTPLPDPGDSPNLNNVNPHRLEIPPEVIEQFFSHTGFISRGDGLHPIPPVNHTITTADDINNVRNFRTLCYGILPEALLNQIEQSDEAKS